MKITPSFIVLLLCLLFTACQPSGTPDNFLLMDQNIQLPEGFSNAVEKKYSVQKNIDNTEAVCTFDVTTLEKAPSNFVVKNIKITLNKGAQNIKFKALVHAQNLNLGTKKAYNTYCTVEIKNEKSGNVIKIYVVTAQGKVNVL
ncbi:hypothetical protein [Chryseobacterium sp. 2987]|uniref:hypothetical protein n=1 Tax=Chryseobacterium sp. 2987 TaxID=2817767 RepID=UPI00285DA689|nr:hypothetical protein [Chryseobacterium sp. 2987]MDR6922202.1 hypothetical protein [Chryseobacterium sp. 2987]